MAVSEQLTAITQDAFIPTLEDNILSNSVIAALAFNKLKKKRNGGHKVVAPIKKSKDTQGGSYAVGDTLTSNAPSTRTNFEFDWVFNQQPIVVHNPHVAMNQGGAKIIDHVRTAMEEAEQDLMEKISTQLYGDGTGNSSKDLLGLAAIVDDGTNVDSYGGKSRATDTWAQASYTGSVGTLSIDTHLKPAYRAAKSGGKRPDIILTTETIWDTIESFFTPTTNNQVNVRQVTSSDVMGRKPGLEMHLGAETLYWRGMPVLADEFCTSGALFMLNSDKLVHEILVNPVFGNSGKLGLSYKPMEQVMDQDGQVGRLFLYSQFYSTQPRTHAQLAGIS